ncbi:P-loop ATPase, Sll1717 family [Aeromicrobium phragmitis]|uniref:P-loop ATPase, Sll1717 family n=1 Tax=Aeromicrobium phragmitis TaxID=2478914 RepID=UPI0010606C18|nr:hypothetical protein [Aeromicrobium phragmitis]
MRPAYKDLYFGKSDSRNEVNDDRDEFVKSYVDLNGAVEAVTSGRAFLILGPKGTGKSALAWYLSAAETAGTHLALVRDAANLPLAEIPRLQTGQAEGPERTVTAWKFILLCSYLELLLRDHGCKLRNEREVLRIAKILRDFGFMGDASGRALVRASSTTITIPLPSLGQIYKKENRASLNIFNLIPYMERWVAEAQSETRHVLVLDGLDSIFLNDTLYDESLSSLVQAAYSLNQILREHQATGSVALLIRNDVFARVALSLPDSQKMRDDLSIDLDWRVLSGQAGVNAPLMQLVNAKAARALDLERVDVLSYFPEKITVGQRSPGDPKRIPTFQYLLNMTRHTPRDLLRLFEEIRKVESSGLYGDGGETLADEVIHEGVLKYSAKYFVGAIQNEFAGFEGGPEQASAALSALKFMNAQTFDRKDFEGALAEVSSMAEGQTDSLLQLLFYAGAIGNYLPSHNESHMQFFHRRDETQIYLKGHFILHHALIHAWGLKRSRGSSLREGNSSSRLAPNSQEPRRRRNRTRGGRPIERGPGE